MIITNMSTNHNSISEKLNPLTLEIENSRITKVSKSAIQIYRDRDLREKIRKKRKKNLSLNYIEGTIHDQEANKVVTNNEYDNTMNSNMKSVNIVNHIGFVNSRVEDGYETCDEKTSSEKFLACEKINNEQDNDKVS